MKKQHKKVKESRLRESRTKLKLILKQPKNMKIRKIKVKEKVKLADGTYMDIDTHTIITMSKEEAIRIGFIKRKKV